jgi:hypothetical protein
MIRTTGLSVQTAASVRRGPSFRIPPETLAADNLKALQLVRQSCEAAGQNQVIDVTP